MNNDDLTILPIMPEESEFNVSRPLHPNLPDVYRGQLLCIVGPVRSGKGCLIWNLILGKSFYEDLFDTVAIIQPTCFNDSSARFAVQKYRDTCFDKYDDKIIEDLIENQKRKKKIDGENTSYALIIDDCVGEFNKHSNSKSGGAVLNFTSRFRHYVTKPDPCLIIYSTQKYLDLIGLIRNNMTGILLSGAIKNKKELDSLRYDLDDTFGGKFNEIMAKAREIPYSWVYFRLDSTPVQCFLNFKEQLF